MCGRLSRLTVSHRVDHPRIDVRVPFLQHGLALGTFLQMIALVVAERHGVDQVMKQCYCGNV